MKAVSKLFLAPTGLSGCLFGAIYRDTRGIDFSDADRINHFPASPLVSITFVRHGQLFLPGSGQDWSCLDQSFPLPRISIMQPNDAPVSSWSPGEVEAVTFGIYPDAWRYLGGNSGTTDLPVALDQAIEAFAAQDDPDVGWADFSECLERAWMRRRTSSWQQVRGISDWVRALTVRTALSGRGKSIRALERRLKRFSGHTKRKLEFYAAFENTHRVSRQNPHMAPAEIALEAGYSDQSHLGRAVRRATGFSPAYLNRAIEHEEAFWCYRLLGERF